MARATSQRTRCSSSSRTCRRCGCGSTCRRPVPSDRREKASRSTSSPCKTPASRRSVSSFRRREASITRPRRRTIRSSTPRRSPTRPSTPIPSSSCPRPERSTSRLSPKTRSGGGGTNTTGLIPSAPAPIGSAALPVLHPSAQALIDTVTVVAGITRALPFGGSIADAIFNGNDSSLYLTNPTLGRVEIFQVANTAFVAAGIPTAGPQPWGIALWPRDTLGNYGDTIIVANAGGVELSVIDVRAGVRRLAWRQDLPDYLIETYRVLTNPLREEIIVYDVSDRPQYVSTVCRPAGGTVCAADSIFAIYSTSPTVSSNAPFSGRATLRMEKLINTSDTAQLFSHLFWELSGDSTLSSSSRDTLRVEMRRGRPYNQQVLQLSACAGVTIELATFGLGDSTFVRNSGNFTHAIVGEGGSITTRFARVIGYTTKAPLLHGAPTARRCDTSFGGITSDSGENDKDVGVTPSIDVSGFISNTGVRMHSIATNFNGGTNLARAV